ncbi:AAA family ATPase [Mycobacterium sp.]|uniref:AAA family ATPase n=1 Tax=Mycobacterium sp. TaxID=1785 RepID=UPI00344B7523
MRLTAPRAVHQREGHERYTLDCILAEEVVLLDQVDARGPRAQLWVTQRDTAGLSADEKRAVENVATSPWPVCPLAVPAGAGKTSSMGALGGGRTPLQPTCCAIGADRKSRRRRRARGCRRHRLHRRQALKSLGDETLRLDRRTVVVVNEAGMVGTDDLRQLLTARTGAGVKTVLVGDAHRLAPVTARGSMFAQLCSDLPWAQRLSEVWRMRDLNEQAASLGLRDGGLAPVRRAVEWYRSHERLHTGDEIAMAHDALQRYRADTAAGEDALLVCACGRAPPRRRCPRRLQRRLLPRPHHSRLCGHHAFRAGRHRRHYPCRARREHHPRAAVRRDDPRPRVQHRLPTRPGDPPVQGLFAFLACDRKYMSQETL